MASFTAFYTEHNPRNSCSCFIRVSRHLKTIKTLGIRSRVSQCLDTLVKHLFWMYYFKHSPLLKIAQQKHSRPSHDQHTCQNGRVCHRNPSRKWQYESEVKGEQPCSQGVSFRLKKRGGGKRRQTGNEVVG